MARKRILSNAAWIGVGTVVLIGAVGTTYYFLRNRKPSLKEGCPPGEHVGTRDFSWAHPELFLDESGFGAALETFGYDVGDWSSKQWRVCGDQMQRAVREFQTDYNIARPTLKDPPTGNLRSTGLIDEATVEAIAYVHELQAEISWPTLVYEVRNS